MSKVKDSVKALRQALLADKSVTLEELACEMLGQLVGVVFTRARGGSQRGGDGGVHGEGGRHLIYEARRYDYGSELDDRSIRGEIDEAVERDPDLEAWVLVATRNVPEQTLAAMEAAGRPRGIETFAIDWTPRRLPKLAALCASCPEAVESVLGEGCGALLADIAASEDYPSVLESIRHSLQDAAVGYELLRRASHVRVRDVWASARNAEAFFGQNVAGGEAGESHIERAGPMAGLDAWEGAAEGRQDQPALVIGREGTGKTWAVVDWLQLRLDRLPIVVLAPSRSLATPISGRSTLIAFIAQCLRDLDHGSERGEAFWEGRVRRLLGRPAEEKPVFLLFFDGLNEQPSYDWLAVFNQLQVEPFHGCVRVVASARQSFVDERMGKFLAATFQPIRIEVGVYDATPGGEFDKKLAGAGLSRDDLPASLFDLARTPRLFDLVIRLRDRLGGVEGVTVHRLFWEYGATAIRSTAFSAVEWRAFVLNLAEEFRRGGLRQPRGRVERLGRGAATPADEVYRRVSSVIDGVFATLSEFGEIEFEAKFVCHALGLALVRELDGTSAAKSKDVLERFFQPINFHDEEAEIVRAAVSIALAKETNGAAAFLGALCSWWIQCPNFPEGHQSELASLAPELVEPLLDAVEQSEGHAASSPRYRAVNALYMVDHGDEAIAHDVATRGAKWLGRISQEHGLGAPGRDSQQARRRKRLESRIGTAEIGCLTVLGREVEIVPRTDEGLFVAAAQLLQGRPLIEAIDFFEAGALHLAITGEVREEQTWLNVMNAVDPAETGARLRERSAAMAQRVPEDGVHADLNRRVAAILMWRTGYEEDTKRALDIEPGLDRMSYADDYLSDPAKSMYGLERRHVDATLRRHDLNGRFRTQRASSHLVDPTLPVPEVFVEESVRVARALDWDNMAVGRSWTSEDWIWHDLLIALARGAPQELDRIERGRLRRFASRDGDGRFGAAMAAPDAMLLVGKAERDALRELRERTLEDAGDMEGATRTDLLIAEIQGEEPGAQLRRIVAAELDEVDVSLSRACGAPSMAELEELVAGYWSAPRRLLRIAEIVGEKEVTLAPTVFDSFVGLLFGGFEDMELEPVWVVLGLNAPERLGALLDEKGWTWSAEKPYIENVMGSIVVAAANRDAPFESFAARLAPMRLLAVLSERDCTREDVELGADLLGMVVVEAPTELPETALEVSHDRSAAEETMNYLYSYGDIREDDKLDPLGRVLNRSRERYQERRQALADRYRKEVMEARERGAHFHLEFVRPEHFGVVLDRYPEAVDIWLEGMAERSPEFVRRARVADGFFVSLCEVLLTRVPDRGVTLWRTLRECLTHVNFTVHGDMDRLLQALFAAASSAEVEKALGEVYTVQCTHNDKELVGLVVAARQCGRLDWLYRMVTQDASSACPLHQRRAAFLAPLLAVPEIVGNDGWPEGEFAGGVQGASWKLGQREAFARHWLETFTQADSEVQAYAAWRLFLACVDRRVWSWMNDLLDRYLGVADGLDAVKRRFVVQQKRQIRRAIADNEKQWGDNYAHHRYPRALSPWN